MSNKRSPLELILFVVLLGGVVIASGVVLRSVSRESAAAVPATEPIVTIVATINEITATTEPTDPSATQTLAALATVVKEKEQIGLTAIARPPVTPAVAPTGIYDDTMFKAQLSKEGFDVLNAWFGLPDGMIVTVYAGASQADLEQGAVRIFMILPYRNYWETILTPDKTGPLKVLAENNNRLTLVSTSGSTYYFDVPALRFVGSLEETVATATPPPTYTPYAPPTVGAPTGYPEANPTLQVTASP